MNEMFSCGLFQPPGTKVFGVMDDCIVYGQERISFEVILSITTVTAPTPLTNGVTQINANGRIYTLCYKFKDRERAAAALSYAKKKIEEAHGVKKDTLFEMTAHTGTSLEVYETYLVLYHMRAGGVGTSVSNVITGGNTGGKRINFVDITGIQFKEPAGMTVGFIQFIYPGSNEVQGGVMAAINDENSIPVSPQNLQLAKEIVEFVEAKRAELRTPQSAGTSQVAAAEEIKKFKELLEMGIITQEEFDAKKKQLLGL